jgi:hypothetical protein
LVAFKLDRTDSDKLKIMLFQVKGGSARITEEEITRLKKATKKIEVDFNWSEKPEKLVSFGRELLE